MKAFAGPPVNTCARFGVRPLLSIIAFLVAVAAAAAADAAQAPPKGPPIAATCNCRCKTPTHTSGYSAYFPSQGKACVSFNGMGCRAEGPEGPPEDGITVSCSAARNILNNLAPSSTWKLLQSP
jgi:hypothetical protein